MNNEKRVEALKMGVVNFKSLADDSLSKFKEGLETNPDYAFRWGDDAVYSSQMLLVCSLVNSFLESNNNDVEALHFYLTERVVVLSRYDESSTSVLSNYAKRMYLKALAMVLRNVASCVAKS